MRFVGYAGRVESVTGLNSSKKKHRRRRIDEKKYYRRNAQNSWQSYNLQYTLTTEKPKILQTHEISRSKTPIQIGKGKKRNKLDHIENGEEHESIKPP